MRTAWRGNAANVNIGRSAADRVPGPMRLQETTWRKILDACISLLWRRHWCDPKVIPVQRHGRSGSLGNRRGFSQLPDQGSARSSMVKVSLPDINILLALVAEGHTHHSRAGNRRSLPEDLQSPPMERARSGAPIPSNQCVALFHGRRFWSCPPRCLRISSEIAFHWSATGKCRESCVRTSSSV